MTRIVMFVAASVLVIGASLATAQSVASSLQGRVVRWGTNEPVAKATVELRRVQTGLSVPFVATSTADGTFVFTSIPAGQYRVVATRAGFVKAEYGQRWPNGAGTLLTVPPGQAMGNVPIPMLQTAAISGTVRDQFGRPLGNADVDAYTATYRTGRRVLTKVQSVVSDDRGEYRLFWLTPGHYFVAARHPELSGGPMRVGGMTMGGGGGPKGFQRFSTTGDNAGAPALGLGPRSVAPKEKYMAVYYPNTSDETAAGVIEVTPGSELPGIDFVVAPVPLHRVRGRVVYESNNEPAMSARVQWVTAAGASPAIPNPEDGFGALFGGEPPVASVECCEGTFELGLPSGIYTLIAAVNNLNARTSVTVGDSDLDGIVLSLGRGFSIAGRVTFEGRTPTPAEVGAFRLGLAMDPPVSGLMPDSYSTILPSGSFTIEAGRGDFRLAVAPLLYMSGAFRFPALNGPAALKDLFVKSIRLGAVDVLNAGLHLEGPVQETLDVVISSASGSLEGRVVGQDRQAVPNVTVALVPDQSRRGRIDLMKSTSSDSAGRFRVDGVPPGDYVAFAIDGPDDGEWQNPDALAARETKGVAVRITADAPAQAELVAQPPTR
jgi:hypothetical protein